MIKIYRICNLAPLVLLFYIPSLCSCSSAKVKAISSNVESDHSTPMYYGKNDTLVVTAESNSLGELQSGPLSLRERRNKIFAEDLLFNLKKKSRFKELHDIPVGQESTAILAYRLKIKIDEVPSEKTSPLSNKASYIFSLGFIPLTKYKRFYFNLNIIDPKTNESKVVARIFDIEMETQETLPGQHGDDLNFYVSIYRSMWLPIFEESVRYSEDR